MVIQLTWIFGVIAGQQSNARTAPGQSRPQRFICSLRRTYIPATVPVSIMPHDELSKCAVLEGACQSAVANETCISLATADIFVVVVLFYACLANGFGVSLATACIFVNCAVLCLRCLPRNPAAYAYSKL